jgi:hypothetical protein
MNLEFLIKVMANFARNYQVDYFTFGAVAMNFWIPPRFTNDLDLVFCIKKGALSTAVKELNKLGFKISASLHRKLSEGRIINLPIGTTKLDLKVCFNPHDYEALKRARPFTQGAVEMRIATAEDIILYKLQPWRRQDHADVERILAEYKPLDKMYIEKWLDPIEENTGFPVRHRLESLVRGEIVD